MAAMHAIPLVRVRYVGSFAWSLDRIGAPTERLLNSVGLSQEILAVPDGFMPVEQLWRFTALAARYTGTADIGLVSGLTPLAEHSEFGHRIMYRPTLYQAITQFCGTARSELTNAQFSLRRGSATSWFCGGPVEGTDSEIQQVELYRMGMMLQTIRATLGRDWQPRELRLQSLNENALLDTDLIRHANVEFGCEQMAIGFPSAALSLTLDIVRGSTASIRRDPGLARPPDAKPELEDTLREIIRTHIRAQNCSIRRVADALDLSTRGLQRELARHGTSFSELLESTRIETARHLLEQSNARIIDIAMETGYTEATHFTRAFRRVTGLTPRQYRERYNAAA